MAEQEWLNRELRGPGHTHPTSPPEFLSDRITKYEGWLAKRPIDADGICAMMKDGAETGNSELKDRFIRQVDILRVLQMKLKDKTLIGWNTDESTSWMLFHFSGKYKKLTLPCCADHRKGTSVLGRSNLKDVSFSAKATCFLKVSTKMPISNLE